MINNAFDKNVKKKEVFPLLSFNQLLNYIRKYFCLTYQNIFFEQNADR